MISLVIFGVAGYAGSLAIENLTIELWVIILITSLAGALLSLLYFRPYTESARQFSIKSLVLGLIPYLVLLPGVISLFICTDIQISHHGPFHSGYIYQILHGISPPDNVVLPGFSANVYWLYHSLIATLSQIFDTAPPLVAAFVNIMALIATLHWVRKSLSLLELKNKNSLITSCYTLLVLFGTSLFSAIHLSLAYIIRGHFTLKIYENPLNFVGVLFNSDKRLLSLFKKFLNLTGTPLGILFFCFTLYISLLILKGELTTKKILLLAVAISGSLIFHTTSGGFSLLIIPISLFVTLLIINRERLILYIQKMDAFHFIVLAFIILILFIPILHYVFEAAKALPASTSVGTSVGFNIASIVSVAYPVIPFSLLAIYVKYREKTDTILFFTTASLLGFLLSIFINLPDKNQYKFIYLSTITTCFLSVIGLDYMYYSFKTRFSLVSKLIFYAIFVLLSYNILNTGFIYLKSIQYRSNAYYYKNKNINLKAGVKNKESYEWIRDNSAPDTVIIIPLQDKDKNDLYLVAQRLAYVAYGDIYAEGFIEYDKRVDNVNLFYSQNTTIDKKVEILGEFEKFSQKRDTILLIPSDNLEPISSYLDTLELIYSDQEANLYSFKNN